MACRAGTVLHNPCGHASLASSLANANPPAPAPAAPTGLARCGGAEVVRCASAPLSVRDLDDGVRIRAGRGGGERCCCRARPRRRVTDRPHARRRFRSRTSSSADFICRWRSSLPPCLSAYIRSLPCLLPLLLLWAKKKGQIPSVGFYFYDFIYPSSCLAWSIITCVTMAAELEDQWSCC